MNNNQEQFSTGSVRDSSIGKLRYDLIPPFLLKRLAQHYTSGAEKYSERNWEKGQPLTRIYASLMRHVQAWANGQTDEDHLSAIAWNAFAIMFTEHAIEKGILPKELDDRPWHMKPESCLNKIINYPHECSLSVEVKDTHKGTVELNNEFDNKIGEPDCNICSLNDNGNGDCVKHELYMSCGENMEHFKPRPIDNK